MKKLLIGALTLASTAAFANQTPIATNTATTTLDNAKKFSISLRKDVNLQISGVVKFKYAGETHKSQFGVNELESQTIAAAYTSKLSEARNLNYDIGASFSKIDPTNSESKSTDYVEHLRIEGNVSRNFLERFSVFGGLNVSKFTRGEVAKLDAGLGIQFGLQAKILKNLKADLRYWETNTTGTQRDESMSYDYDYKISSTTLGLSYIF